MRKSPLHAVLTQRERRRDTERVRLGQLLNEDRRLAVEGEKITEERSRQQAELADMSRSGRIDVNAASARKYYTSQLNADVQRLGVSREKLSAALKIQRQRLAAAEASVKAVENLIEKREAEQRLVADRKAQLVLEDEWAAQATMRARIETT